MPFSPAGARPAGGGHAAALLPGRPRGPPATDAAHLLRLGGIRDHGVSGKNKTAGRRPAVFAKCGVWSRGRG